ncbi:MAG: hypothetical protein IT431_09820 [Phycisphaerales bacterium]|nr:hypothetical protein [Phycisphaerales bacterium]
MTTRTTTLLAAAAFLVAGASASAQVYRLGVGNGLSWSVSDNGAVVGETATWEPYFMWTAGGGYGLIGGAGAGAGVGGTPRISNDGMWVGGTAFNANNAAEMSRYEVGAGTWTNLGGLGQQIDAEISSGWGISGDGQSVVGLAWVTDPVGKAHAAQWTLTGGMTDLGSNAYDQSSRANGANYDGSVVIGWQDGNGRQGAAWVNGVQELIVDGSGNPAQEASAVSEDGVWVSGMGIGSFFGAGNGYRYNTDTNTYELLPNLAVGAGRYMAGNGITADGNTIVGGTWAQGPASWGNAFVWRDGLGTVDLTTYLDEMGVAYDASFHFSFISDVSSDGLWMTGWGYQGSFGNTESFVIHIPTPASAALLGLGALTAVRRRR